jgi:small subunit ribosomal protein S16
MLSIRLTRTGKVHDPHYRVVVQEKRSKLNGKVVDTIGHYHPTTATKELVIDAEKAKSWMAKGAQPSTTVTNLMVKAGVLDPSRKIQRIYTIKAVEEEVAAPAAEAPSEEAVPEAVETADSPEVVEPVTEEAEAPTEEPAEEPAA